MFNRDNPKEVASHVAISRNNYSDVTLHFPTFWRENTDIQLYQ